MEEVAASTVPVRKLPNLDYVAFHHAQLYRQTVLTVRSQRNTFSTRPFYAITHFRVLFLRLKLLLRWLFS